MSQAYALLAAPQPAVNPDAPPTLADFGHDPVWLVVIKTLMIFVLLVVLTLFTIWYERRVVARMQQRPGPNRNGPFGLLQSLADGLKLALKEDIIPLLVDKPVYFLAPMISAIAAFMAFAVIPIGPMVSMFGHWTPLQLTDLPVAVLYLLAATSFGVYGIVLAGWSSGSTYPLLGGLRSSAQVISYEVAMGLAMVGVFLNAGTLSTSEIVANQSLWYLIPLLPSFLIYLVAGVGDTNRAPFDLPEAESELVGGFHIEYSSLKFALFFLAEYINMVTVSALATTLFLGGWKPVWPLSLMGWASTGWVPAIWWLVKVLLLLFVFVWLRGTLPRFRYDQFMRLGWKLLIPASLVWLLVVAVAQSWRLGQMTRTQFLITLGVFFALLLFALSFLPERKQPPSVVDRGVQSVPIPDLSTFDVPTSATQAASRMPRETTRA